MSNFLKGLLTSIIITGILVMCSTLAFGYVGPNNGLSYAWYDPEIAESYVGYEVSIVMDGGEHYEGFVVGVTSGKVVLLENNIRFIILETRFIKSITLRFHLSIFYK